MDRHVVIWFFTVIVALLILGSGFYYLNRASYWSPKPVDYASADDSSDSGPGWTVYGSMNCGWTRKQLSHMDDKNVAYKFVDCDSGDCPGVSGFPTLKNDDGTVKVGYTPM
jgi:hypothetical protein